LRLLGFFVSQGSVVRATQAGWVHLNKSRVEQRTLLRRSGNLWIDVPEEKEEEREVCKKTSVGVYR